MMETIKYIYLLLQWVFCRDLQFFVNSHFFVSLDDDLLMNC